MIHIVCFLILVVTLAGHSFAASKPVVKFGVNLRYHPITMYQRYQPLMDYLTRTTPYKFELHISRDYRETAKALDKGETQIASLGDGAVMEAMLLYGAIPLVKPLNEHGKAYYRSVIVVATKSDIKSLKDMKGKRLALGCCHSTTGNLVPRFMLQEQGVAMDDLAKVANLKNHDTVARSVIRGEYDAGAVKDVIARNYADQGLRIVAMSQEIPSIPIVAGKKASGELKSAVTKSLLALDRRSPGHRSIMDKIDAEYRYGFAAVSPHDYRDMARLFNSIPLGCSTGCHR